MLVTDVKGLLMKAKENHYAIPSYNFWDLDSARAHCSVADREHKPIFLSYAEVHRTAMAIEEAAAIGKLMAERYDAPIVLHLDHGQDLDFVYKAMDLGFTSIMIDASMKDFDENVAITRGVALDAHKKGIQVEAEIGHVGSNVISDDSSLYTQPEEAARFVEMSGCDSLAVSIGTSHGAYKTGTPKINFDVLHALRAALPNTPLVLHGGSGSGDENLKRCAREGIAKLNIYTDLSVGGLEAIRACASDDYLVVKKAYSEGIEKVVAKYFDVFDTQSV